MVKKSKGKLPKQNITSSENVFKAAVEECPDLKGNYCIGLKALKDEEASKIITDVPKQLNGSIDIDKCLKKKHPEDNRWDYAIGYKEKSHFVEFHPAHTSEVNKMINKKKWLECWLDNDGQPLYKIHADENFIHWIFTGKFAILKNSSHYKKLVQHKIIPVSNLTLK